MVVRMSKHEGGLTVKKFFVFFTLLLVYLLIISVQYFRITHFLAEGSMIRVYREIIVAFIALAGLSYAVWIKKRDQI